MDSSILLNAQSFRAVVSGRRTGVAASALRGLLRLAEFPYTWAIRRRNSDFDNGRRPTIRIGVPVVSVGNLTLGGTGKTPMVKWLARWFGDRGIRIALVSRGYKSAANLPNDEARELEHSLPAVPHLQSPDRVAAARKATDQFDCQVILIDDGFQHRRIHRDLDIVLIDALEPFGFRHVFPRGTLREPLDGLKRADVVVLTRADMASEPQRKQIRGVVEQFAPSAVWAECRHAPQNLLMASGKEEPLNSLRGSPIGAFCGIGNPAGFRHTLEQCGFNLIAWREFPDHHSYNQKAIDDLSRWADSQPIEAVVCTHKDLVKLAVDRLGSKPLWALTVGLEFLVGQQSLERSLENLQVTSIERQ